MTISREAARHNLQMIADGEPLHVGEDGLLHIGEGNQARVQGVVDQTLESLRAEEEPIYVRLLDGERVEFVTAGCLRIQSAVSKVFAFPESVLQLTDEERKVLHALAKGESISIDKAVSDASRMRHYDVVPFLLSGDRCMSRYGFYSACTVPSIDLKMICLLHSNGQRVVDAELRYAVHDAVLYGAVEVAQYLLNNRVVSKEDFAAILTSMSWKGYVKAMLSLLSEGRALSQEGLSKVLLQAAKDGHIEIVRFLLREYPMISREMLVAAVQLASENGHIEVVNFLLSQVPTLSKQELQRAILDASRSGHLEVVHILLSQGHTFLEGELGDAVWWASVNGHIGIVCFLASQSCLISNRDLDCAVVSASMQGYIEIVRFLLSQNHTIAQKELAAAVKYATEKGYIEIVRLLLSEGRTLSQKELATAVKLASVRGYIEIVGFLLSEGRMLFIRELEEAIRRADESSHIEVVLILLSHREITTFTRGEMALRSVLKERANVLEAVLRNGPIHARTLGFCRWLAANYENHERISDLLDSAPVVSDPAQGASAAPLAGDIYLTLGDVKEQPQVYLDRLAADGMPRRVILTDNPKAVDLGGVTKRCLTTLFGALLEQRLIRVNAEDIPLVEREQDREVLKKVGQACSHIAKRNSARTDKFLVGGLFSERFYKLVHLLAKNADNEEQLHVAKSGSGFLDHIEAAKCFYAGLDDATRALFAANANLQDTFQGQSCTKEALLAAMRFSDVGEQEAWIWEMIEGSDQQWRQRIVFALTGNKTLAPGLKLEVRRGWRSVFELHTCFNSLDVPADMAKEDFIAGVNASLIGEDYNIG